MSCDSSKSNVQFESVNPHAIALGLLFGETQARKNCAIRSGGNKAVYSQLLDNYKSIGVVGSSPAVNSFLRTHSKFCSGNKMIGNGNFFGEAISLTPLCDNSDYTQTLKGRMTIGHELTEEEMLGSDEFITDLTSLHLSPDVQEKAKETTAYKRSIERLWTRSESQIIGHMREILGDPNIESSGKVSVFIMYPNFDMQRTCQLSSDKIFMFLGKTGENLEARTLASIADGAARTMVPIKSSMTKDDRDKLECFIRFLADKEIYTAISGESGLKMETPEEKHALMGKMYPYFLGYKHRNDHQFGLNPAVEIDKEIKRDRAYFDSLPAKSSKRTVFSNYAFSSLDPEKIASYFRYKKTMTPYDFIHIDFNNREFVSYDSPNEVRVKNANAVRDDR